VKPTKPQESGHLLEFNGPWNVGTGVNGFYLNFSDNSDVTAATLGADYSGNGNKSDTGLAQVV
jgi:hypothetical protein